LHLFLRKAFTVGCYFCQDNRLQFLEIKIKKIRQDKFIFYATGFGIKTNLGEKTLLIDAHLAENERGIQLIEINFIQFNSAFHTL
jgi:hypothetical protein